MRMKSLILIFIALGCGLVASIGISQVMERGGAAKNPQMEMEQILVALADVDINGKLDATNVKLEEWPKMKVPEGAVRSLADVEGKFALQRFYKGEPIVLVKISDNTDNSASRIPEGFRAMPVLIAEDTVLKGIAPGDRVDVNVFLRRNEEVRTTGTHTILTNVRVFAVGSNTERSVDDKGQEIQARTVSLLVKPEQARELAMATQMGKIILVLRHPGELTSDTEEAVTPFSEILNGKASSGDENEVAPEPQLASGGSFLDAIKSAVATPAPAPVAPVAAEPKFVMTVFGPNDVKQFEWADRNAMPTEQPVLAGSSVSTKGTPAPTPTPTTTNLGPASGPNNGPDLGPTTNDPTIVEPTTDEPLINGEEPPPSSRSATRRAW